MLRRLAVHPIVLFFVSVTVGLVVIPYAAHAQDAAAITAILNALPEKWALPLFGVWLFAFYFVGPLLKRQQEGPAARVGEYLTQDTRRPPSSLPSSSSTVTKIGGAALLLALAGPALAQESQPAFGGAVQTARLGLVTFGPSAAVALASYDPANGELVQGFKLAPGYGVSIFADRWYVTGLTGALLLAPSSEDTPARAAVMLSFARYIRLGYGYGGRILAGVGVGP